MNNLKKAPLLVLFMAAVFVLSFCDLFIGGEQEFSELENRYLAKRPEFTLSAVMANSYTKKYEEYVNDQFIGRGNFIALKSLAEKALGKVENNSVVYGADDYLFEKFIKLDVKQFRKNREAILEFIETHTELPVKVSLVPSSYVVLADKLPAGLPNVPQSGHIAEFYAEVAAAGGMAIDAEALFAPHSGEYIYYRTDHHWTNRGATLFYEAYMAALGEAPFDYGTLPTVKVKAFAGTYQSKAKPYRQLADTIEYYELNLAEVTVDGTPHDRYYNAELFEAKDKYGAFLWGNNGHTVLKAENPVNDRKVLVIKDSYGNAFAPLLTGSFGEVHIVDLRSVGQGIADILEAEQFDEVLILYSFSNFTTDMNVFKMNF